MTDRLTWSSADVAAALGRPAGWLRNNTRRLRAAGFPRPLPVVRRYDPAAVRAWIVAQSEAQRCGNGMGQVCEKDGRRNSAAPGEVPPSQHPAADDDAAWGRLLDQRARRLGRAGPAG